MTEANMEAISIEALIFTITALPFKHILCIYYLIKFKKNQVKIWALLNFGSKVNAISPAYTTNLGLKV